MSKKVFKVTLYLQDGSSNYYRVVAKDDVEAKEKSEKMEQKGWKDSSKDEYPGVDFCEVELVCKLDE